MTIDDLVVLFRSRANDDEDPPLWSDDDIIGYIDYAQRRMSRALGGIRDSQSVLCTLLVPAGSDFIALDPSILKVHSAHIPIFNPLTDTPPGPGYSGRLRLMDRSHPDAQRYRYDQSESIRGLIFGEDDDGMRPWKIPTVDTTIQMVISRLPVPVSTIDGTAPTINQLELREELHYCLIHGMLAEGYKKQDAETRNDKLSEENETAFERDIEEAARDSSLRRASPGPIAYGGI